MSAAKVGMRVEWGYRGSFCTPSLCEGKVLQHGQSPGANPQGEQMSESKGAHTIT